MKHFHEKSHCDLIHPSHTTESIKLDISGICLGFQCYAFQYFLVIVKLMFTPRHQMPVHSQELGL